MLDLLNWTNMHVFPGKAATLENHIQYWETQAFIQLYRIRIPGAALAAG